MEVGEIVLIDFGGFRRKKSRGQVIDFSKQIRNLSLLCCCSIIETATGLNVTPFFIGGMVVMLFLK